MCADAPVSFDFVTKECSPCSSTFAPRTDKCEGRGEAPPAAGGPAHECIAGCVVACHFVLRQIPVVSGRQTCAMASLLVCHRKLSWNVSMARQSRCPDSNNWSMSPDPGGWHAGLWWNYAPRCLCSYRTEFRLQASFFCVIESCRGSKIKILVFGLSMDSVCSPMVRKGVPAHAAILTSYLRGLSFGDGDVVVVADVLPNRCLRGLFQALQFFNLFLSDALHIDTLHPLLLVPWRHAEFGRAALERMLDGSRATPQMYYVGCLRPDQGDVKIAMEKVVYDDWDRSPTAPARSRPVEPQPDPNLLLLTWSNNSASFPDSVLQKFPEGTTARAEILELKRAFIEEFGGSMTSTNQTSPGSQPALRRATGRPDFSIDGGAKPHDLARDLNLPLVASSDFSVQRTRVEISSHAWAFPDPIFLSWTAQHSSNSIQFLSDAWIYAATLCC